MIAVPLITGDLIAENYENQYHQNDPRIDILRDKMQITEDKRYSDDYHDPSKRSIANAIQIFFKDGSSTEKVEIEYPVGHRRPQSGGDTTFRSKI